MSGRGNFGGYGVYVDSAELRKLRADADRLKTLENDIKTSRHFAMMTAAEIGSRGIFITKDGLRAYPVEHYPWKYGLAGGPERIIRRAERSKPAVGVITDASASFKPGGYRTYEWRGEFDLHTNAPIYYEV